VIRAPGFSEVSEFEERKTPSWQECSLKSRESQES
jgi:hypothetical protein